MGVACDGNMILVVVVALILTSSKILFSSVKTIQSAQDSDMEICRDELCTRDSAAHTRVCEGKCLLDRELIDLCERCLDAVQGFSTDCYDSIVKLIN